MAALCGQTEGQQEEGRVYTEVINKVAKGDLLPPYFHINKNNNILFDPNKVLPHIVNKNTFISEILIAVVFVCIPASFVKFVHIIS